MTKAIDLHLDVIVHGDHVFDARTGTDTGLTPDDVGVDPRVARCLAAADASLRYIGGKGDRETVEVQFMNFEPVRVANNPDIVIGAIRGSILHARRVVREMIDNLMSRNDKIRVALEKLENCM